MAPVMFHKMHLTALWVLIGILCSTSATHIPNSRVQSSNSSDNAAGFGTLKPILASSSVQSSLSTSTATIGGVSVTESTQRQQCMYRGVTYQVGVVYEVPAQETCGQCHTGRMKFWCLSETLYHYCCGSKCSVNLPSGNTEGILKLKRYCLIKYSKKCHQLSFISC